jgi:hypothetical protein
MQSALLAWWPNWIENHTELRIMASVGYSSMTRTQPWRNWYPYYMAEERHQFGGLWWSVVMMQLDVRETKPGVVITSIIESYIASCLWNLDYIKVAIQRPVDGIGTILIRQIVLVFITCCLCFISQIVMDRCVESSTDDQTDKDLVVRYSYNSSNWERSSRDRNSFFRWSLMGISSSEVLRNCI